MITGDDESVPDVGPKTSCYKRFSMATWPRVMFFGSTAALATSTPWFAAYYYEKGFDAATVGMFLAFDPVAAALMSTPMMVLADRFKRHTEILVFSVTVVALASISIWWSVWSKWTVFASLAVISSGKCAYWTAVTTTVVVLCPDFGKVRLFGSLGWGSLAIPMGILTKKYGLWLAWFVFPEFFSLIAVSATLLHCVAPMRKAFESGSRSERPPFFRSLRVLLTNCQMIALLVISAAIGAAQALTGFAYFTLRTRFPEIGDTANTIIGCCMAAATVSELPMFFFSMKIIGKIGERGLILVSCIAAIARCLAFGWVPNPWMLVGTEVVLNGLMYAAAQAAGIRLASKLGPVALAGTSQSLFGTAFSGVGGCVGVLAGGWTFNKFGPVVLFTANAIIMAAFSLLWIIYWAFQRCGAAPTVMQELVSTQGDVADEEEDGDTVEMQEAPKQETQQQAK